MATHSSSPDMIHFVAELAKRYNMTMRRVEVKTGERPSLKPEQLLQVAMLQRLIARFATGQHWHDDNEVPPLQSLADFVIDIHRQMTGAESIVFSVDPKTLIAAGK